MPEQLLVDTLRELADRMTITLAEFAASEPVGPDNKILDPYVRGLVDATDFCVSTLRDTARAIDG